MQLVHIVSQRKDDGSEQCIAATDALVIYSGMDASLKSNVLNDFISHGRGKTPDALKFRYQYQRVAVRSREEKLSATENDVNRHGCCT